MIYKLLFSLKYKKSRTSNQPTNRGHTFQEESLWLFFPLFFSKLQLLPFNWRTISSLIYFIEFIYLFTHKFRYKRRNERFKKRLLERAASFCLWTNRKEKLIRRNFIWFECNFYQMFYAHAQRISFHFPSQFAFQIPLTMECATNAMTKRATANSNILRQNMNGRRQSMSIWLLIAMAFFVSYVLFFEFALAMVKNSWTDLFIVAICGKSHHALLSMNAKILVKSAIIAKYSLCIKTLGSRQTGKREHSIPFASIWGLNMCALRFQMLWAQTLYTCVRVCMCVCASFDIDSMPQNEWEPIYLYKYRTNKNEHEERHKKRVQKHTWARMNIEDIHRTVGKLWRCPIKR